MNWHERNAFYDESLNSIVSNIIKQMREGEKDWRMPWHKGLPEAFNRVTGKFYSGSNQLILWDACLKKDYSQNVWATLRQWNKRNSGVKKGSKGTLIKFVIPVLNEEEQQELELDETEKEEVLRYRIFLTKVFNADQVTNLDPDQQDLFGALQTNVDKIQEFVDKTDAKIVHGGTRAMYMVNKDTIYMPHKASFKSIDGVPSLENYYSTILHELIHWTGHPDRCDRSLINHFGSNRYAFEELIAELGTAILSSRFNNRIVPRRNHSRYLNHWLTALDHDSNLFIEALELARAAIYWLYKQTGILNIELKQQYDKVVDASLAKDLDDYFHETEYDNNTRQLLDIWEDLDVKSQKKLLEYINKEVIDS